MSTRIRLEKLATNAAWRLGRKIVSRSNSNSVVTVCEYPKSGGTWIAKNISTALNLPYVGNGAFLPLIPCVIRTHWNADKNLAPLVVVVRDVRDVMVSLFHHRLRNMDNTPARKHQYNTLLGEPLAKEKIREQLAGFMSIEFDNPRYGARKNWSDYTREMLALTSDNTALVSVIKYEDALQDTAGELARVLEEIGKSTPREILDVAAQLHDAKWGDARSKHLAETTFLRKASAGGWKETFNRESAQFIAERCNGELLALGYEQQPDWWEQF